MKATPVGEARHWCGKELEFGIRGQPVWLNIEFFGAIKAP